jgi:hypothetical protein
VISKEGAGDVVQGRWISSAFAGTTMPALLLLVPSCW